MWRSVASHVARSHAHVKLSGTRGSSGAALCTAAATAAGGRFSPEARAAREERRRQRRSVEGSDVPSFAVTLKEHMPQLAPLRRRAVETVQLNIGLTCNMSCHHCHVESTPTRQETMTPAVFEHLMKLLESSSTVRTLDITGGAPEMHALFKPTVERARSLGLEVIDRCNLTILMQPGYESMPQYLADNGVRVTASMPCYDPANVDKQRGENTFDQSIAALRALNDAGYGQGDGLALDLVYNPVSAHLPPPQEELEAKYKEELWKKFEIRFDHLFCITNMPIKRYVDELKKEDQLGEYMSLLRNSFNPATVSSLMCTSMVHVRYDGKLSDCDFNSALEMPLGMSRRHGMSVFELEDLDDLVNGVIGTGKHCYGCTAGGGSSCQGALAE